MAAGTSLPSDFTPVPQVMLPHMRQAFVTRSAEMLGQVLGSTANFPIQLMNDPGFIGGGQYLEGPTFVQIVAETRRDITSVSAITADKITGVNNKGVIQNRRTNLISFADDTFIAGFNREQISAELGQQLGEQVAEGMCANIIAALRGIIEAVTSSAHTKDVWSASVKTLLTPDLIDDGRFLMGDRMDRITHMIVRGESNRDLRSDAIGRGYDTVGGLALQGADNRNQHGLIKSVRDDSLLQVADAGYNKAITLLLGAGVLKFWFVKPVEVETIRFITNETKSTSWRADWDQGVQCGALAYNSGAGGANPSTSALATSANWTDNMTSAKELNAVEIIHNATAFN